MHASGKAYDFAKDTVLSHLMTTSPLVTLSKNGSCIYESVSLTRNSSTLAASTISMYRRTELTLNAHGTGRSKVEARSAIGKLIGTRPAHGGYAL